MRRVIENDTFENFILIIIFVSTIQLAVDNPLRDPESMISYALMKIDYVVTAIFFMEAVLKTISNGLYFNGSYSYLRNSWNILDFTIVLITLA